MERFQMIMNLAPMIAVIVSVGVAGWVITTWLRIKNGYPLDGAWGQAVYPKKNAAAAKAASPAARVACRRTKPRRP